MSASAPADPPRDAWGLPIVPPDPPIREAEVGYTTDDDGEWEPKPVTRTAFAYALAAAAYGTIRYLICKTGMFTRRRYR